MKTNIKRTAVILFCLCFMKLAYASQIIVDFGLEHAGQTYGDLFGIYHFSPYGSTTNSGFLFSLYESDVGVVHTVDNGLLFNEYSTLLTDSLNEEFLFGNVGSTEQHWFGDAGFIDLNNGSSSIISFSVLLEDWGSSRVLGKFTIDTVANVVPEPSILALMFTGLFGLGIARRRVANPSDGLPDGSQITQA